MPLVTGNIELALRIFQKNVVNKVLGMFCNSFACIMGIRTVTCNMGQDKAFPISLSNSLLPKEIGILNLFNILFTFLFR